MRGLQPAVVRFSEIHKHIDEEIPAGDDHGHRYVIGPPARDHGCDHWYLWSGLAATTNEDCERPQPNRDGGDPPHGQNQLGETDHSSLCPENIDLALS